MIRAAVSFANQRLGTAILVGREDRVKAQAEEAGIELKAGIEIMNARLSTRRDAYAEYLYKRLQRKGFLYRDCVRLANTDRNHFAACMVALGDADAVVTGVTRNYPDGAEGHAPLHRRQARASHHRRLHRALPRPHRARSPIPPCTTSRTPSELADIAVEAAGVARRLGFDPRVALLAYSTFGDPTGERAEKVQAGGRRSSTAATSTSNMTARWAPTWRSMRTVMATYPFCRLSGPANVLVMPARHSAAISAKMLHELGGCDRARPAAGRLRPRRCRSCRSPRATPTSSTWPRSPPSISAARADGFKLNHPMLFLALGERLSPGELLAAAVILASVTALLRWSARRPAG